MSALRYEWAVSTAAISQIIPETCGAIHQALKDDFLTAPATPEEWVGISNALEHTLNFPNALGRKFSLSVMLRHLMESWVK